MWYATFSTTSSLYESSTHGGSSCVLEVKNSDVVSGLFFCFFFDHCAWKPPEAFQRRIRRGRVRLRPRLIRTNNLTSTRSSLRRDCEEKSAGFDALFFRRPRRYLQHYSCQFYVTFRSLKDYCVSFFSVTAFTHAAEASGTFPTFRPSNISRKVSVRLCCKSKAHMWLYLRTNHDMWMTYLHLWPLVVLDQF